MSPTTKQHACVLLVFQNQQERESLAEKLRKEDYQTAYADNFQIARQLLDDKYCNLVLLDVSIGEESGIEFMEQRRQKGNPPLFIFFIDPKYPEDFSIVFKTGNRFILNKPYDHQDVCNMIERARKLQQNLFDEEESELHDDHLCF